MDCNIVIKLGVCAIRKSGAFIGAACLFVFSVVGRSASFFLPFVVLCAAPVCHRESHETKHTLSVFVQGKDETVLSRTVTLKGPQADICFPVDTPFLSLAHIRHLQNYDRQLWEVSVCRRVWNLLDDNLLLIIACGKTNCIFTDLILSC